LLLSRVLGLISGDWGRLVAGRVLRNLGRSILSLWGCQSFGQIFGIDDFFATVELFEFDLGFGVKFLSSVLVDSLIKLNFRLGVKFIICIRVILILII